MIFGYVRESARHASQPNIDQRFSVPTTALDAHGPAEPLQQQHNDEDADAAVSFSAVLTDDFVSAADDECVLLNGSTSLERGTEGQLNLNDWKMTGRILQMDELQHWTAMDKRAGLEFRRAGRVTHKNCMTGKITDKARDGITGKHCDNISTEKKEHDSLAVRC